MRSETHRYAPRVSVITPVYNRERLVGRTIQSLLEQTYKNLELVLIDDGSTDNSLLMLNQFAEKHDHIRLVIQQNQGQTRARMNGIAQSTGEFLAFLDCLLVI